MNPKRVGEGLIEGEYPLTQPGWLYHKLDMVWLQTDDGQTWAVNGHAKAFHQDIGPIWKDHQSVPGLKVSISGLIDEGRSLK